MSLYKKKPSFQTLQIIKPIEYLLFKTLKGANNILSCSCIYLFGSLGWKKVLASLSN